MTEEYERRVRSLRAELEILKRNAPMEDLHRLIHSPLTKRQADGLAEHLSTTYGRDYVAEACEDCDYWRIRSRKGGTTPNVVISRAPW